MQNIFESVFAFMSFLTAISYLQWDHRDHAKKYWNQQHDPADRMPTLTVVFQVSTKEGLPELGLVYHPCYSRNLNVIQNIANKCGELGNMA